MQQHASKWWFKNGVRPIVVVALVAAPLFLVADDTDKPERLPTLLAPEPTRLPTPAAPELPERLPSAPPELPERLPIAPPELPERLPSAPPELPERLPPPSVNRQPTRLPVPTEASTEEIPQYSPIGKNSQATQTTPPSRPHVIGVTPEPANVPTPNPQPVELPNILPQPPQPTPLPPVPAEAPVRSQTPPPSVLVPAAPSPAAPPVRLPAQPLRSYSAPEPEILPSPPPSLDSADFYIAPPRVHAPHQHVPNIEPIPEPDPIANESPDAWAVTPEPETLPVAPPPPTVLPPFPRTPAESVLSNEALETTDDYSKPIRIAQQGELPRELKPMWWSDVVRRSIGVAPESMPISIDELIQSALVNSYQIQSFLAEPEIRRATVQVESAAFDWTAFVESQFDDTSDPIGSTLTTGNLADERFVDQTWAASAGLRRRNRIGGETEISQNGGHQRNNSQFLIPNPQGTTRLEFSYTQPLLNNTGRFVNESRIMMAKIDLQATDERTKGQIQNHLIEITDAYWDLYLSRSQLLQKRKLLESAHRIHQTLLAREGVDVLKRQVLRAEVAVTSREAEVIRAQTEIRNAQSRLRNLVNDPRLVESMQLEWTPQDQPLSYRIDVSAQASAAIAMATRPEISEAMKRVKALSIQADVARWDLLPKLDLILRSYISGLDDSADTIGAWETQWTDGRPTYGIGLTYEFPLGNRAANGRLRRSRWELTREVHSFEAVVEQTLLDVDIAVREIHTSYREMVSKQRSVDAATAEVQYLDERWRLLPTPQDSAVLLLENLLDAQQRLGVEEASFAAAQVAYARSWIALRRAMGTLLQVDSEPVFETLQSAPVSQPTMLPSIPEQTVALPPMPEQTIALPPMPEQTNALPPMPEQTIALPPMPDQTIALPPMPEPTRLPSTNSWDYSTGALLQ